MCTRFASHRRHIAAALLLLIFCSSILLNIHFHTNTSTTTTTQTFTLVRISTNGLRLFTSIRTHSLFIMVIFPSASIFHGCALLNYVMSVILLQRIAIIVTTNILNLINRGFPYTTFVLHLQIVFTTAYHNQNKHGSLFDIHFLFCCIFLWPNIVRSSLVSLHIAIDVIYFGLENTTLIESQICRPCNSSII